MVTRRTAILGLLASGLATPRGHAAGTAEAKSGAGAPDEVPNEGGSADFASAWTLEQSGTATFVSAVPDVPMGYAERYGNIQFSSVSAINDEFQKRTSRTFINWFNENVAGKQAWSGKRIVGEKVEANFNAFWDQYCSRSRTTLLEFIAYMSVFVNECDGNLVYQSERYGTTAHPGIAYLFDSFTMQYANGRVWRKASYNTGRLNRSAFSLFNDNNFLSAHSDLMYAKRLANTNDLRWDNDEYPVGDYPTSGDAAVDGLILETDFYKFRDRGLIQTTWRTNYLKIVEFIKTYEGTSPIVSSYSRGWAGIQF